MTYVDMAREHYIARRFCQKSCVSVCGHYEPVTLILTPLSHNESIGIPIKRPWRGL